MPDRDVIKELLKDITAGVTRTPEEHCRRREELERAGRPVIKNVGITELWQRQIDRKRLRDAGNAEAEKKHQQAIGRILEQIAADRFSAQAARSFRTLKKLTRYHEHEKRDGGFLQRAITSDGRIVTGDELHQLVMRHYREVHNMVRD